jgi:ATP-dependent DNA helicase RecG
LELEEKQGWRNRAVFGGLQAMAERWQADAASEASAPDLIDWAVRLMAAYDAADQDSRPEIAAAILRCLEGDAGPAQMILDETESERMPADEEESAGEPILTPAIAEIDVPPPEPTFVAEERALRRHARASANADSLRASPEILPGVGKATAEQLARLGIACVEDLLWHLPTRYEDFSTLRTIAQLAPGEQATVIANLWEIRERKVSMKRTMVQGILGDSTGTLRATWWNKYVQSRLRVGETMRFSGKVGLFMGHKTLESPEFEDLDEEMVATGRIAPVYRLTEGLTNKRLRGLTRLALDGYASLLTDPLPEEIRAGYQLPDLAEALHQAHFPESQETLASALRRLAFEEFFYVQLGVMQRRRDLHEAAAMAIESDAALTDRFTRALPFALTGAQERVLGEVLGDMRRTVPMTRLVQGDVGSGKTAVAAAAMYVAAANGAQSALLAPTQILAEQHFRSIGRLLGEPAKPDGSAIVVELLTGRVTGREREAIMEGLRSGAIDVVVGTTALIQETVDFANLGFVVVDEQHRFGVEQRGALRNKGGQPHLLVMSATPIPRSLALTVYGELDVSVIDEMPPGRQPVRTKRFRPAERERLHSFMRRQAAEGRQGYIVYPLVEESEKLDAGAAVAEFERLQTEIYPDLRLGLLHGRMSGQDKDEVMSRFAAGEFDILVSTTVIEVGIDVPNATVMIVEDAERFGLAQLHQLRGRVGRGEHDSYCALISGAEGGDAEARLRVLEETNNGFVLAEKDLELRGPGDFLGTRQSGLPDFRVAHLGDVQTLVVAREAAQSLFAQDPELAGHPELMSQVQRFWRGHGDVS